MNVYNSIFTILNPKDLLTQAIIIGLSVLICYSNTKLHYEKRLFAVVSFIRIANYCCLLLSVWARWLSQYSD